MLTKKIAIIFFLILTLVACTTPPKNIDPFESYNRVMHNFNESVDKVVLKPVAQVYEFVTPEIIRVSGRSFFANIGDIPIFFNDILQLKFHNALIDLSRITVNSTIGLAGFIDVASQLDLKKNQADFGLTLAHWGVKYSPYVVLPFFGPSTLRDAIGRPVDWYLSIWPWVNPWEQRLYLYAGRTVIKREELLSKEKILDVAAFDKYVFMRDAYLQNRRYLIDGLQPVSHAEHPAGVIHDDFLNDEPMYEEGLEAESY